MKRTAVLIAAAVALLLGGPLLAPPSAAAEGTYAGISVFEPSVSGVTLRMPVGLDGPQGTSHLSWDYVLSDASTTYYVGGGGEQYNGDTFHDPVVISLEPGTYTLSLVLDLGQATPDVDTFSVPVLATPTPVTTTPVTPSAPIQSGNVVTIPSVTGVTYAVEGTAVAGAYSLTEDTTVTATADDGYLFPEGTVDSWSFTYAAETADPGFAGTSVYDVTSAGITLHSPGGLSYPDSEFWASHQSWYYVISGYQAEYHGETEVGHRADYTAVIHSEDFTDPVSIPLASGDYSVTLVLGRDEVVDTDEITITEGGVYADGPGTVKDGPGAAVEINVPNYNKASISVGVVPQGESRAETLTQIPANAVDTWLSAPNAPGQVDVEIDLDGYGYWIFHMTWPVWTDVSVTAENGEISISNPPTNPYSVIANLAGNDPSAEITVSAGATGTLHADPTAGAADVVVAYERGVSRTYHATWAGHVTQVNPIKPTQSGNVVTIPLVAGVTYSVGGATVTGKYALAKNVTVAAQPQAGYAFPAGAVRSWTFVYTAPVPPAAAIRSATLKITKKPTRKKAGKATFTITSATGAKVIGTAVLVVAKGKTTKRVAVTVKNGKATIKVPKLTKGTWKIQVQFKASSVFKATNTKVYKVKVKR